MVCCGVCDDGTSALSCGARPAGGYPARFDDLFGSLAQRRGFRECLAGLLAPRYRNKTLTVLVGAEPGDRGAASGGAAAAVLPLRVPVGC